jgi:hypothetical protein
MMTEQDSRTRGRGSQVRAWTLLLGLLTAAPALGGEFWPWNPGQPQLHGRFAPAGGWHPDAGGLLHWWNPGCFPRCGGPDDYCRKPPPRVCWPPYPPYYIWLPQPASCSAR